MVRLTRMVVAFVMVAVLAMGFTSSAFAGIKDGQSSTVTVEKRPQILAGFARPATPTGLSAPIKGFPKWPDQYFNSSEFFFWLNLGYFGFF